MMRILVSNDDGVNAKGIKALQEALSTIAEVDTVAPDRNRSAASNSLTLMRPLRVSRQDNGFYSVQGTPTDCVHLAVTGFLDPKPDMVISGVNDGANLGDDILYSGTVAAAMEGRFLGLPAIALSMVGDNISHFQTGARVAKELVLKLKKLPLPSSTILNVNIPDLPFDELKGYEITRLGSRHCSEPLVEQLDPRGQKMYWVGPPGAEQDAGTGTDFYAIKRGYVSITPLQLDMTHYEMFSQLSEWMGQVENAT